MATTTIPWGDGSGDNITLTYASASGNQSVTVSSDANTGAARTKTVTFTAGLITQTLTVNQEAGLPYTPLEYIQTDGTAYINTGISGNAPKSVTGKMLPVAPSSGNSYYMGCRKDSGNTRFCFLLVNNAKTAGMAYYNGSWTTAIDISSSVNNGTPMEFHSVLRNGTILVGVKQQGGAAFTDYTRSVSNTVTTNREIYLLAWNNQGSAVVSAAGTRCYGVKIYNSNNYTNLVFDGVPCIYNGEYGLWDNISNSFKGNAAGSGAFTGA